MCKIVISAATGTGSVRIQGIPFNPLIPATAPLYFDGSGFTWPTGRTSICAFLNTDGNTSLQVSGSLTAISGLAMANAAAELYFTCTYLI